MIALCRAQIWSSSVHSLRRTIGSRTPPPIVKGPKKLVKLTIPQPYVKQNLPKFGALVHYESEHVVECLKSTFS